MPSTTQAEWLNENSLRAYPFRENSTRIPSSPSGGLMDAAYAIPNYLFVDALLSLPYRDYLPELFVSSLTLSAGIVTVALSAHSSGSDELVGTLSAPVSSGQNSYVEFVGTGAYSGARGAVVFGDLARFGSDYPDGVFLFDRGQTTLETRCVRPSAKCVSGIVARSSAGSYSTSTLYGDVALIAGENVRLSYDRSSNSIRIDVDSNSGYNEECDCGDGADSAIASINGLSVNELTIEGDDCISVEVSEGRILLKDHCSRPCMGCEELTLVNTKVNDAVTATSRLLAFAQELSSRLEQFKTNFLESERSPIYHA